MIKAQFMSHAIASVNPTLDSQFILNGDPSPNTIPEHHRVFLLIIIRLRKLNQLLIHLLLSQDKALPFSQLNGNLNGPEI